MGSIWTAPSTARTPRLIPKVIQPVVSELNAWLETTMMTPAVASAMFVMKRVFIFESPVPVRLRRRVPVDRHGRRRRWLWEVVETARGRALLPQAESRTHERALDCAQSRELEHLEPEIVRRACAGQRL